MSQGILNEDDRDGSIRTSILWVSRWLVMLFGIGCAMQASVPALAAEQPFDDWLTDLRAEARASGISEGTLDAALSGAQPLPRVIELDRSQP